MLQDFLAINFSVNNPVVTFFASFLVWILMGGLFVLWITDGKIQKEQVLYALYATFFAWTVAYFIKEMFPTLRPFLINGGNIGTVTVPFDGAFPSQHTAIAFALGSTIYIHNKKIGWIYFLGAISIGIARVIANVHYPLDIIGGALIGALSAIFVERVHFNKLIKK
jgi:undecaprenyl-diphosphatase